MSRCLRGAAVWLAALPLVSCGPRVSIRYAVSVAAADSGVFGIRAELRHVPRDSLVLAGFAGADLLRVSDFDARGPDGKALPACQVADSITTEDGRVATPRFVLHGPLPGRLTITYRAAVGAREGDAHFGFTGVTFGYSGSRLALVTGRSLFLLPSPGTTLGDLSVRFAPPPAWQVAAPWAEERGMFRPGAGGAPAAEALVAATIGIGSFRERVFELGRTRFRIAFESGVPDSEAARCAALMERAAGYVQRTLGRDLGPDYLVIATRASPEGDEIRGESWGSGQGGTLAPMTPARLERFAEALIGAHVRSAPYRVELSSPDEYWLVDAIERLLAWRAVAFAGLADEDAIERDLAVSYLNARRVSGAEQDLERLYRSPRSTSLARELVAPFMLASIDRELRARSHGRDSIEAVVGRMFRSRPAASLWTTLPGAWGAFRAQYVRGREALPVAHDYPLAPARPLPSPPTGPPARHLTLVISGDTNGFLEHCGCKVNQSGGVARRATMLERLRRADPGVVVVDAGNAFLRPERMPALDFLSREEQKLYLRTMALARYDAMAIGVNELAFGPAAFHDAADGLGLPFTCANGSRGGAPLAPPSRIVTRHGVRVAVVGVLEPPQGPGVLPAFDAHGSEVSFADPVAAVCREVDRLKCGADVLVAIGRLTPATARRLAAACPDLDAIVTTASRPPTAAQAPAAGGDDQGFLGRTLLVYEDSRNYGLEGVDLVLDAAGRVASVRTTHYSLFEDVPDDRSIRGMLDRFYARVGTIDSAQASVQPLFAGSPQRLEGRYVGARRCAACHDAEFRQWKTTRHASAFKTLLDAHRHYQPRCVVCHVVGFRTAFGYRIGAPEEPLGNVQCEVCHGPGGAHADHPATVRPERQVAEGVCRECHTPDHSDHFDYTAMLPLVMHQAPGRSAAAPAAAR